MRWRAGIVPMVVAACTAPQSWTKTGADASVTAKDTAECEDVGRRQALRRYPYMAGAGPYGSTGMILSQQQDNANRSSVQVSVFNDCMQRKGYARSSSS
ncbi:MAG: hypothetical protein JO339_10235 [Alphaproteobacteria bacterium]|nr:hypothetical protein [Alphaproteobacteria bacterium]